MNRELERLKRKFSSDPSEESYIDLYSALLRSGFGKDAEELKWAYKTYHQLAARVRTTIRKDQEYGEFVVRLYVDGKIQKGSEYYTADRGDAKKTAEVMKLHWIEKEGGRQKT